MGVHVSGDYAYIADGSSLAVIDISDPTNPGTPVYEAISGQVYDVFVSGDYAYVACGDSGLAVIDISDPTNPTTPVYEATFYASDVYVEGDYAYVADDEAGLAVVRIRITDFVAPSIETSHSPSSPNELDSVNVTAYVTDENNITEVILSYSNDSQSTWTNITMDFQSGDNWTATIPSQSVYSTVHYKVYARDIVDNWNISVTDSYLVANSDIYGPLIAVEISPSSPTDADDVTVTATVTDTSGVDEVILSYSTDGQSTWTNVTMVHQSGDDWNASIPLQSLGTTAHYRVYANDTYDNWEISTVKNYTVMTSDSVGPSISIELDPSEPYNDVTVTATVIDTSGVGEVTLSFSTDEQSTWTNVTMVYQSADNWTASIPQQSRGVTVYYKVYARDGVGNWATSTAESYVVSFVDETPPDIDQPGDIQYVEGVTGNTITWSPSDLYPAAFEILKNGTSARSGPWDGSVISIDVDGLAFGVYNYTLIVSDDGGNTARDTVFVSVIDLTAPVMDHPLDVEYEVGGTGNSIVWQPSESNPDSYRIMKNGTVEAESDSWDGSGILLNVDGLAVGVHNYTLIVWDTSGNSAGDSVIVRVFPAPPPPPPDYLGIGASLLGIAGGVISGVKGIPRARKWLRERRKMTPGADTEDLPA
ncbi:MAG: LVIVD repeat-containing protein [Candidatus Thorarchaeota archaeon]|jgi:hypothetical protein